MTVAAAGRTLPWSVLAPVVILAGLTQAASLALPGSGSQVWWLQLLALSAYAWTLRHAASGRQGFVLGWLFALAWIMASVWWLFIAMHTYGGLAAPLAALALFALCSVLALFYGMAGAVYVRTRIGGRRESPGTHLKAPLKAHLNAPLSVIWFGATWLAAEMARGMGWWGFGWGGVAYAHVDGPFAGYAPWIGAYGIGIMVAMACALIAQLADTGLDDLARRRPVALTILALALVLALPWLARPVLSDLTHPAGELDVALLQGNIPQNEKFEAGLGVPMALQWYGDALMGNTSALVVAPETAIPVLPRQLPAGYVQDLQARYATGNQLAVVGVPLGSFSAGYTNSAIALGPVGANWRYDKHHLVPFGEFIPTGFHWFTRMMQIPLSDFRAGARVQPALAWQGQRLGVNICYEDLFGEELAARFADEAQAPTVFVNLSNIAWFGEGLAIDQHLAITRMRALELGRPFVRATNTGATAIVSADGNVQAMLPRATRGILTGRVEGRIGLTPYARWMSRTGLSLWWFVVMVVAVLVWRRKKQAYAASEAP